VSRTRSSPPHRCEPRDLPGARTSTSSSSPDLFDLRNGAPARASALTDLWTGAHGE
jgi:hypothetical protein